MTPQPPNCPACEQPYPVHDPECGYGSYSEAMYHYGGAVALTEVLNFLDAGIATNKLVRNLGRTSNDANDILVLNAGIETLEFTRKWLLESLAVVKEDPPAERVTITQLEMTCAACPSQWEGQTADGKEVYGRYRWGHLTLDIAGQEIFSAVVGNGFAGVMNTDEFLEHIKPVAVYQPKEGSNAPTPD